MSDSTTLKYLISHDIDAVDMEIVRAVADKLVPGLRALLQEEARAIALRHEPNSPFIEDAAMRLMLTDLAGFLSLTYIDSLEDCVLPHQLTAEHVNFWLTSGGEGAGD